MRSAMNTHKRVKAYSKSRSKKEKRRPWTSKEDETMQRLVQEHGTKQWTIIAEKLNNYFTSSPRTGKQCRERWHNHLNSGINKGTWTLREELTLFSTHAKIGNKWAEISNYLPGRTDNSIKNHFYSTLRKQYRSLKGTDSTRDQLKKHTDQLASALLSSLQKQSEKLEDLEFSKSQEVFYNCVSETPGSPPDLSESFVYSESDFMIYGQHIDLPPPISPIHIEEAPMEFKWLEGEELPDEVFLMPSNSSY